MTSGGFPRNAAIRQKHSPKRKLILSEAQRGYKIRLSGRIKCVNILPRRESNLTLEVLRVGALALPIAAGGLPPLRPARPAPAQRNQASEYILVLKTWRKRNKESKRIDVRESQLLSVPNTKRTPYMRGSYTLPEFVPKSQEFPIWRNDFGVKNGAQAKQRVEAYLAYARVNCYPFPTQNEPPI